MSGFETKIHIGHALYSLAGSRMLNSESPNVDIASSTIREFKHILRLYSSSINKYLIQILAAVKGACGLCDC
jgi:hypothetical protein